MDKIAIIMGSISDKPVMDKAADILKELNISQLTIDKVIWSVYMENIVIYKVNKIGDR